MAQNITFMGANYSDVPAVNLPKTGGGAARFTDVTDTTAAAADVAQGKYFYDSSGVRTAGTASGGGGGVNIATKTVTASNYPTSLSFTGLEAEPKAFVIRCTTQISSSGSTTYYYIIDLVHDGSTTEGTIFRIGSTRRTQNQTTGYSFTYSNGTLTVRSSASSRSATPGAFYNGSYDLVYIY